MCTSCCFPCQTYSTAEDLNKSGILYCLLGCFMPCIPILLLRGEAREKYGIEVSDMLKYQTNLIIKISHVDNIIDMFLSIFFSASCRKCFFILTSVLFCNMSTFNLRFQGSTVGDVGAACCCPGCALCQTAAEVKERGDHK